MNREEKRQDLWIQVYVATIKAGYGSFKAKINADEAVSEFDGRFVK